MAPKRRATRAARDADEEPIMITPAQLRDIVGAIREGLAPLVQPAPAVPVVAPPAPERVHEPAPVSFSKLNNEFTQLEVYRFFGDCDAYRAQYWLEETETYLRRMHVSDTLQIELTVQQFKGRAHVWWTHLCAHRDVAALTWAEFRELFCREFIPAARRSQML